MPRKTGGSSDRPGHTEQRRSRHLRFIPLPCETISMSGSPSNNYPKLHNAAWPGVVGKGGEGAEPYINLATMLDLTAAAQVDGIKWKSQAVLDSALKTLTAALRPWTLDFHVAQNDATVFGSGSHDHTGCHCLATDPSGKLNIPHHAGFWLRDESGKLTKKFRHVCWDGCMFPNAVMMKPQTWNDILAAMISVRDAHGWRE